MMSALQWGHESQVRDRQFLWACWIESLLESGIPLLGEVYGESN